MTNNQKSMIMSYELMVKNNSLHKSNSKNNYDGARKNDVTATTDNPDFTTASFDSVTVTAGTWLDGMPFAVHSTTGSGTGLEGTVSVTDGTVSIGSISSHGRGYESSDDVVLLNNTSDTDDGLIGETSITIKAGSDGISIGDTISVRVATSYTNTTYDFSMFAATITMNDTNDFTLTITNPGYGLRDAVSSFGAIILINTDTSLHSTGILFQITPVFGSVGTTFSNMRIIASLTAASDVTTTTYIWPRDGSAPNDDTSVFNLPINIRNVVEIQLVSFQILENTTESNNAPEFVTLNNFSSPHAVRGSSGGILSDIIAHLDASSQFQKSYGALDYKVRFHRETNIRNLMIQLYDVSLQPFNLASDLAYDETDPTSRAFHGIVTFKFMFH